MNSIAFLKRFWAWALSLLGLVAGYLALHEAGIGWVIFVVAGVAFLLASARQGFNAIGKLRSFPKLVADLSLAQRQLKDASSAMESLRQEAENAFARGVKEGRGQVLGAVLSSQVAEPPQLRAMGLDPSGEVTLTAAYTEGNEVPVGARFELQVAATGDPKGTLEAFLIDEEGRLVHMRCVQSNSDPYWGALAKRALDDPSPPPSVCLVPTTAEELTLLGQPEARTDSEVASND